MVCVHDTMSGEEMLLAARYDLDRVQWLPAHHVNLEKTKSGGLGFRIQMFQGRSSTYAIVVDIAPDCSIHNEALISCGDRLAQVNSQNITRLSGDRVVALIKSQTGNSVLLSLCKSVEPVFYRTRVERRRGSDVRCKTPEITSDRNGKVTTPGSMRRSHSRTPSLDRRSHSRTFSGMLLSKTDSMCNGHARKVSLDLSESRALLNNGLSASEVDPDSLVLNFLPETHHSRDSGFTTQRSTDSEHRLHHPSCECCKAEDMDPWKPLPRKHVSRSSSVVSNRSREPRGRSVGENSGRLPFRSRRSISSSRKNSHADLMYNGTIKSSQSQDTVPPLKSSDSYSSANLGTNIARLALENPSIIRWDPKTIKIQLLKDESSRLGFEYYVKVCQNKEVYHMVRTIASAPAEGKLYPGDWLRSVNGVALDKPTMSQLKEVISLSQAEVTFIVQRPQSVNHRQPHDTIARSTSEQMIANAEAKLATRT